ncbi:copper amine oxidase N-terminal domain-containing protein [Paenibacillus physcomitrellae]|uniref:copper amine oxidase N-terminal domain-containing protein n=1 Tax=Paenibacillus physcomitrellae TaxID=1619311 RepID=UPI003CC81614
MNGKPLSFNTKPILINGNTMVPFRQIFESLGMNVNWDSKTKNIIATKADLTIKMTLDSFKATVNNKEFILTQTPFDSPDGIVYVNLRFISEAVGATVSWDNVKKIASIDTE